MGRHRLIYPGDTPHKADTRNVLYRTTAAHWKGRRPPGVVVVLAGPEAKEVSLLRNYLRWPASRVLFVDVDERGLRKAKKEWPGVGIHHGYVHEAVKQLDIIAMLNLDLMGMFNDNVERTLVEAADKVVPHGIVAYTFYRSREHVSQHSFQKTLFAARRHLDVAKADFDTMRWVGTAARMQRCLQFENPKLLLTESYRSDHSAMGLMAVANEPRQAGT